MDVDVESQAKSEPEEEKYDRTEWMKGKISNEEDWDIFYKKTQHASLHLELKIGEHYGLWWKLISCALYKQDKSRTIVNCLMEMINSAPLGTTLDHRYWDRYINAIYGLARRENISLEVLLEVAEKKFTTYTKASSFWTLIRKLERRKTSSDEDYRIQAVKTYKKQFSKPYIEMDLDYHNFLADADVIGMNDKEISMINALYRENEAEAERITKCYMDCFNEQYHHVKFEEWVDKLLEQTPPLCDIAVGLCEETVVDESSAICYHFILAKTLVKSGPEFPEMQEKLFRAIKRGVNLGQNGCEGATFYYLDFALQAAASYLSSSQCSEIVDDVISKFDSEYVVSNYFASRKALIFGLTNLAINGKLPREHCQQKLTEALVGVTQDKLMKPSEKESDIIPDYELRCIELKRLLLISEKQLNEGTLTQIIEKWRNICSVSTIKNPDVLVEYTAFIREYGTPSEAETAYIQAIERLSVLNESMETCTYSTRRCMLLLMKRLRELLAVHGGSTDATHLISDLSKRHWSSSLENNEMYYFDYHPQIAGQDVARLLFDYKSMVPDSSMTDDTDTESSEDVVPEVYDSVMADYPDIDLLDSDAGFPIFLSNISFKASKKDIENAFEERGLTVKHINMKTTPKNTNYGYATIKFTSVDDATTALTECDRMEILGRQTFVSEYKPHQKYSAPSKPEPTVLIISGLPEEWRNSKKIENALRPFGHIKMVEVKEEAGTAKVEYHMPGDTIVGLMKLEEEIMADTGVVIRKGYPNQKATSSNQYKTRSPNKQNDEWKNYGKGRDAFPKSKTYVKQNDNIPKSKTNAKESDETAISSTKKTVIKEYKPQIFVPRQLMKKKLDVQKPETEASTSGQPTPLSTKYSEELEPPQEKRIKTESTSSEQKLTNSDFKKFFQKQTESPE